jgi:hypothetical protein
VIGGDDDVGRGTEAEIIERLAQLHQIVVGVLDAGQRSGALIPDVTVLRLSPVLCWLLAAPLWWRHDACCAVFGSRVPELTRRFADVEDHY